MTKSDNVVLAAILIGIAMIPFAAKAETTSIKVDKTAIYEYLDKKDVYCDYLEELSVSEYGNIKVYHLVCRNNDSTSIYDFVPEQIVQTYYIED